MRKFLFELFISICMVLGLAVTACAASTGEISRFSVTVPTSLTIYENGNRTVSTSNALTIQNNGTVDAYISSISVSGQNSWSITDIDDDFSAKKVDSKQFALSFLDQGVGDDGSWEGSIGLSTIEANSSLQLDYSAEMTAESHSSSGVIAKTVVTVSEVPAYVMLYDDGSFVVQRGDTPAEGKTLLASFTDLGSLSGASIDDIPWRKYITEIKSVSFSEPITVNSLAYWFYGATNLESFSFANLDTGAVTDMRYMFYNCTSLNVIDWGSLDTSNITSFNCVFSGCSSLTTLDLSSWDTSSAESLYKMFSGCSSLTSLNLGGFNTENVTSMYGAFEGCTSLSSLDLSSFSTSRVTDMSYLFSNCSSLTSLDLSGFDTAALSLADHMFYMDSALKTIYASSKWSSNGITSSNGMFSGCTALTGSAGSAYDRWHLDKTYARIDSGSAAPGYFSSKAYAMLYTDGSLVFQFGDTVDSSKTLLDSFTDFYGVSFGSADNVPWYSMRSYIQTVSFAASFAPTSMAYWFSDAGNLAYFNSANLDTSSTTSMAHMFSGCNRLQELDMSSWNTGSVTDMSYMFSGCFGLKELDVSVLNTQSVQNMSGMFQYCTGLSSLDVGGWNVSSVSNMSYLFAGLNIESLHLTNWNTASLTDTSGMFQYDGNLVSIYVGDDWTSENIRSSSNMFGGCSSLSGSAGTKYDAMHTDKLYARIDKDSAPGYFSGNTVFAVLYTDGSLVFQYGNDPMKGKTIEAAYSDIASHGWSAYMEKIVSVAFQVPVAPTTMEGWFNGAKNLTSIDFTNLDTSNVASMNDTFAGCSSLTAINLSGLDTSNVQTMEGMFMGCSKLTSISGLDFDTSKVTVFASMFQDCPALTSLDLSAFDSSRVTNMSAMFSGDEALSGIYVSSRWSTASVTDSAGMFSGCTSLVGGSGTSYTEDHTDADYAKIDGSISDPGYFSGKSAPSKVSKIRLTYSTENNEVMGYTENT